MVSTVALIATESADRDPRVWWDDLNGALSPSPPAVLGMVIDPDDRHRLRARASAVGLPGRAAHGGCPAGGECRQAPPHAGPASNTTPGPTDGGKCSDRGPSGMKVTWSSSRQLGNATTAPPNGSTPTIRPWPPGAQAALPQAKEVRRTHRYGHVTAKRCHSPGTPLSLCAPRSSNSSPYPITNSRSVLETSTSFGPASALTRAPMSTPIPPMSSPRTSHSPVATRNAPRCRAPARRRGSPSRSGSLAEARRTLRESRLRGVHLTAPKRASRARMTASCASSKACQSRSPISAARRVESTMSVKSTVANTVVGHVGLLAGEELVDFFEGRAPGFNNVVPVAARHFNIFRVRYVLGDVLADSRAGRSRRRRAGRRGSAHGLLEEPPARPFRPRET